MNTPKVCLINPPTSRDIDEIFFPMGPLVLASVLKAHEIPVQILDFDLALRKFPGMRGDPSGFSQYLTQLFLESGADIYGITSICSNFPYALQIARLIRRLTPESKIVLGGPQPSSVPVMTMQEYDFLDAIVVGEGENTFLELVSSNWTPSELSKIKGIVFRQGGDIVHNPPRPLIEDLDELPFPDFSLLNLREYLAISPCIALIEAGRGCPFHCSFCSTATFWSRKYRAKSPPRILKEMEILDAQYGLKSFSLTHDNFTTSPKYVRTFSDYFAENNHRRYRWSSSARTDSLLRCNPQKMRRAGCTGLFLGVDSGSQSLQKAIDKHLNLEEYRQVLGQTVELGIEATTSFIVGFPEESKEDLNQTIELGYWSRSIGAHEVQFHSLSPLAGTKIYDKFKQDLRLNGVSSDLSLFAMAEDGVMDMLLQNPELFSSFFTVPTPELDPITPFLFAQFYYVLLKSLGLSTYWIFQKKLKTPTVLFGEWQEFFEKNYPGAILSRQNIQKSFTEFI